MDDRFIDLINRELDGDLSDSEITRLKGYLSQDSEGAELRENLRKLSLILGAVPPQEPPAYLKHRIMEAVYAVKKQSAPKRRTVGEIFSVFRVRFSPPLAYSFATGAVIGVLILGSLVTLNTGDFRLDPSNLRGAILEGQKPSVETVEQIYAIDIKGVTGNVKAGIGNGLATIEISIVSQKALKIDLRFPENLISFAAVTQSSIASSKAKSSDFQISANSVQIDHLGENNYLIVFHRTSELPATISLSISSVDERWEKDISLSHSVN